MTYNVVSLSKTPMLSLNRFTRYHYQLVVDNDVGSSSGQIVTAVTMAGVPHHPPSLSARAVNHTAVRVTWTQPCKITFSFKHTEHVLPSKVISWLYILLDRSVTMTMIKKGKSDSFSFFFYGFLTLLPLSSCLPQLCKTCRERWNLTF